ncbi:hypothetical protein [Streptomyces sp. C8S0]|uniref:hypothetical protein n=1 Tax=Streptomyces sp. C8S0 TaxID=2585716 RepID=UPI00125D90D9|nr:hypothetical protein [Streptomyces sp. C8S0]
MQALQELGLNYADLQAAAGDPIDWTRRIVDAACGPLADGTIEDQERRFVASEVAQWVLEAGTDSTPQPRGSRPGNPGPDHLRGGHR